MKTDNTKNSDILRQAKAMIGTPSKWVKGTADDWKGRRCAVGALHRTLMDTGLSFTKDILQVQAANNLLSQGVPVAFRVQRDCVAPSAVQYNDAPATTHADIMAMFDRAIALAEAKEDWDDLAAASKEAPVETESWPEPQLEQEAK